MPSWDTQALDSLSTPEKIHLFNSITGIKPANLIATQNLDNQLNLAVFSSVLHLGSVPPLLGFVSRPVAGFERHTYENILQTGEYSINAVPANKVDDAHWSSAKFARHQSEFEVCDFTPVFRDDFAAPFVEEAPIKIGLKLVEEQEIQANQTRLIIGEVVYLEVEDRGFKADARLDLETLDIAGINGLNGYYRFQRLAEFDKVDEKQKPLNRLK